jgi:hypothetical protein
LTSAAKNERPFADSRSTEHDTTRRDATRCDTMRHDATRTARRDATRRDATRPYLVAYAGGCQTHFAFRLDSALPKDDAVHAQLCQHRIVRDKRSSNLPRECTGAKVCDG